jgi:hypothetical protein
MENMKKHTFYVLLILDLMLASCATQRASTTSGSEYDQVKNVTNYFVLPYGTVSLPGKWEKKHYNATSRQQFFTNADSISVAIAFNRYDQYEFNADGAKKGGEFVEAFYAWDTDYFAKNYGLNNKVVEKDNLNHFIIYRLFGTYNGGNFDSYFLIGEKNGNTSNFSISVTDQWPENKKVEFLKGLFLGNQL